MEPTRRRLSARTEPFDSYWQAPADVEKGYRSFYTFYRHNYLARLPVDRDVATLVISCGPGYLVRLLNDEGYGNVIGIDSDPTKVELARAKGLDCRVERAFEALAERTPRWDMIFCEQELNHLTKDEMVEFLEMCRDNLRPGGTLVVYGLNGANPLTGAEALAQNFDHFNTFSEYSLRQVLELCGFRDVQVFGLQLYVFWKNPLNYVGLLVTGTLHLAFRILFRLYGKSASIFTKKIAATARKAAEDA